MLRKLSTKTIMGDYDKPKTGEEKFLYRVWGTATRYKTMETDKGLAIGLLGRFRAKRADGKEFDAGTLWLPLFLAESISAALAAEDTTDVTFAYDCFVLGVDAAESPVGYTYNFRSVMEQSKDNDPLAIMENSFTKALPLPGKKGKK